MRAACPFLHPWICSTLHAGVKFARVGRDISYSNCSRFAALNLANLSPRVFRYKSHWPGLKREGERLYESPRRFASKMSRRWPERLKRLFFSVCVSYIQFRVEITNARRDIHRVFSPIRITRIFFFFFFFWKNMRLTVSFARSIFDAISNNLFSLVYWSTFSCVIRPIMSMTLVCVFHHIHFFPSSYLVHCYLVSSHLIQG